MPRRLERVLTVLVYVLLAAAAGSVAGFWSFFPWVWLPLVLIVVLGLGYALFSWLLER